MNFLRTIRHRRAVRALQASMRPDPEHLARRAAQLTPERRARFLANLMGARNGQ